MQQIYFFLSIFFSITFFLIPCIGNVTDPRHWTKAFSLGFFFLGIFAIYKIMSARSLTISEAVTVGFRKEMAFLFCLFSTLSFLYIYTLFQHLHSFFLVDYDFLAIGEILNNSIKGKFFITHHYGSNSSGNYLSHHFAPSILLLSPFILLSKFRLGYAYGLLFYTIVSMSLISILLLRRNVKGTSFYLSMILIAINLPLHRLFFSYHFELLTVFFFILFFVGKEFNKTYLSILSILLLLLLKEDMAIYVFCLGLFFAFQKNWRYAISLTIVSLLYFFFVPSFFQSSLDSSTHVDWLKDWSRWGTSYSEIVFNLFLNPLKVLDSIFSKWKVLREFLFAFSPLILLTPSLILVSLPIFLLHFISDRIWYNTLYNYYSYTVVPFLLLSFIFSIVRLTQSKFKDYTPAILLVCISLSLYSSSGDKFFPYARINTDRERVSDVQWVIENIPRGKTVATQFDLGAFIPRANPLYPLHEKNLDKDFLFIDSNRGISPYVDKERIEKMIETVTSNQSYSLLLERNGIKLYRRMK